MSEVDDFVKRYLERMRELSAKATASTMGIARTNIEQIFHLSNSQVHPDVQMPEENKKEFLKEISNGL